MNAALQTHDALISPAAPTTAYRIGEVSAEPLQMYKGDLMTVNLNLAGENLLLEQQPALVQVLLSPFVPQGVI